MRFLIVIYEKLKISSNVGKKFHVISVKNEKWEKGELEIISEGFSELKSLKISLYRLVNKYLAKYGNFEWNLRPIFGFRQVFILNICKSFLKVYFS